MSLSSPAKALFQIYDKAGLGYISKKALFSFLASMVYPHSAIDHRITEEWLTKILLEKGLSMNEDISNSVIKQHIKIS